MDNEKERLERKHQLERDVADAILALAGGKGYLGVEGLADETERLGTDYRFLAQARRAHKDQPPELLTTLKQVASKLGRGQ
jgi:hypothetical protein